MSFARSSAGGWLGRLAACATLGLAAWADAAGYGDSRSGPRGPALVFAAYVPSWGVEAWRESAPAEAGLTHAIYAFAKPVPDTGTGGVRLVLDFEGNGLEPDAAPGVFDEFLRWSDREDLRRMVSIGGWGVSEWFSDIAATPETRRAFAAAVVDFLVEHDLDGVDLDWEFPVDGGPEGMVHRPADAANLVKLAAAVRRAFGRSPAPGSEGWILTVAVPGEYGALAERYRLRPLAKTVDWFHLMAYDFAGSWSRRTAHYAPLRAGRNPLHHDPSVAGAVAALRVQGVPPGKIVLGLALAGIRFEEVTEGEEGWMNAPFGRVDAETGSEGWNDFRFLDPTVLYPPDPEADWALHWDEEAGASYWVSPAGGTVISFESKRSAAEKGRFAAAAGVRGLMFWSLDKDGPDLPLIRAAVGAMEGGP